MECRDIIGRELYMMFRAKSPSPKIPKGIRLALESLDALATAIDYYAQSSRSERLKLFSEKLLVWNLLSRPISESSVVPCDHYDKFNKARLRVLDACSLFLERVAHSAPEITHTPSSAAEHETGIMRISPEIHGLLPDQLTVLNQYLQSETDNAKASRVSANISRWGAMYAKMSEMSVSLRGELDLLESLEKQICLEYHSLEDHIPSNPLKYGRITASTLEAVLQENKLLLTPNFEAFANDAIINDSMNKFEQFSNEPATTHRKQVSDKILNDQGLIVQFTTAVHTIIPQQFKEIQASFDGCTSSFEVIQALNSKLPSPIKLTTFDNRRNSLTAEINKHRDSSRSIYDLPVNQALYAAQKCCEHLEGRVKKFCDNFLIDDDAASALGAQENNWTRLRDSIEQIHTTISTFTLIANWEDESMRSFWIAFVNQMTADLIDHAGPVYEAIARCKRTLSRLHDATTAFISKFETLVSNFEPKKSTTHFQDTKMLLSTLFRDISTESLEAEAERATTHLLRCIQSFQAHYPTGIDAILGAIEQQTHTCIWVITNNSTSQLDAADRLLQLAPCTGVLSQYESMLETMSTLRAALARFERRQDKRVINYADLLSLDKYNSTLCKQIEVYRSQSRRNNSSADVSAPSSPSQEAAAPSVPAAAQSSQEAVAPSVSAAAQSSQEAVAPSVPAAAQSSQEAVAPSVPAAAPSVPVAAQSSQEAVAPSVTAAAAAQSSQEAVAPSVPAAAAAPSPSRKVVPRKVVPRKVVPRKVVPRKVVPRPLREPTEVVCITSQKNGSLSSAKPGPSGTVTMTKVPCSTSPSGFKLLFTLGSPRAPYPPPRQKTAQKAAASPASSAPAQKAAVAPASSAPAPTAAVAPVSSASSAVASTAAVAPTSSAAAVAATAAVAPTSSAAAVEATAAVAPTSSATAAPAAAASAVASTAAVAQTSSSSAAAAAPASSAVAANAAVAPASSAAAAAAASTSHLTLCILEYRVSGAEDQTMRRWAIGYNDPTRRRGFYEFMKNQWSTFDVIDDIFFIKPGTSDVHSCMSLDGWTNTRRNL